MLFGPRQPFYTARILAWRISKSKKLSLAQYERISSEGFAQGCSLTLRGTALPTRSQTEGAIGCCMRQYEAEDDCCVRTTSAIQTVMATSSPKSQGFRQPARCSSIGTIRFTRSR